jgi:predicted lipoprotein with Yx(FWY)xxD motif
VSSQRVKFRGVGLVVAAAAVVLLAACGSSSSTAGAGAQPSTSSSSSSSGAPTTGASAADVMTASSATLGTVLVDSAGKTLYTLTDASGKAVACTGQCLTFWPPLLLPAGSTTAAGASGVTGLATVSAGGGTQITENGLPLYHFSGDTTAGAANGEGIKSFGGTWHVVKSSAAVSGGAPAPTATTVPAAATTTTGGYGY